MNTQNPPTSLEDFRVNVKLKLSALWASVTFCYLYGDYFGLYRPGTLQSMLDGRMGPLGPVTQEILLGTAAMMAVPSLMVFLCLALPAQANRLANAFFGLAFTAVMLITMPGGWWFYQALGLLEMTLTITIVVCAWRWPRRAMSRSLLNAAG